MPQVTISPDIKAAALAALLAGEQPAEVAERYGLNPSTVRSWKRRLSGEPATDRASDATNDASLQVVTVRRPRPLSVTQDLIAELIYDLLAAKMEASIAIARVVNNPAWLATQTPEGLAELGEYLDRTAFAMLDRLARAQE